MRRLSLTAFVLMAMALGVPSIHASNQDEANRIAQSINAVFPQYMVEVAYKDGKVRLRGEVNNESDRQRIVQLVKRIPNVQTVSADTVVVSHDNANMFASSVHPDTNIQLVSATQNIPAVPYDQNMNTAMVAQQGLQVANDAVSTAEDFNMGTSLQTVPDQGVVAGNGAPMGVQAGNFGAEGAIDVYANYPANTDGNFSGGYGPAPRGIPVSAGRNGQNGEPNLPNYSWPTTADYPNYAQVGYPKQYSASSFPYIGPFYPYPQVPLGWRKVTMEWHDGYWWLDFNDGSVNGPFSPLFRQPTKYR